MNEILKKLSQKNLSSSEVAELLENPKDFPTDLIDKLSIETALNYWKGLIDFIDGDYIMNNLKDFWVTNDHFFQNFVFGKTSWECYEAFDAGEYYRKEDDPNIDPVEKYTKPLIEEFLKKKKLIT